jgi:hypothetical protein
VCVNDKRWFQVGFGLEPHGAKAGSDSRLRDEFFGESFLGDLVIFEKRQNRGGVDDVAQGLSDRDLVYDLVNLIFDDICTAS